MKAIIKRELKNYVKNPILWLGLLFVLFWLFQFLSPYLTIHYFQSEEELKALEPENIADADIMEGYLPATEEERMEIAIAKELPNIMKVLEMSEEEARALLNGMRQKGMGPNEMMDELYGKYGYYSSYGLDYWYQVSELRKGSLEEANAYIEENLNDHSFSYYFGRKFADFGGLVLGFFATILLAFLFIRDMKRDTYELLHTKPISAFAYIGGKVAGGFLAMGMVWGILTLLFGGWCQIYGWQQGFPVNFLEFAGIAAIYILPNMLMIVCVYTLAALAFRNPLPAMPFLFLYIVYSNLGGRGPDGTYGYYGRPLAIMVRFPGTFFDTTPPPLALLNQTFLILASGIILVASAALWKRRRV